jgi:hypothetical protein
VRLVAEIFFIAVIVNVVPLMVRDAIRWLWHRHDASGAAGGGR